MSRKKLDPEEKKRRKQERDNIYYQNNRDSILIKTEQRRFQCKRTTKGIRSYTEVMSLYYTKEHRLKCQQQLKKDFQELQQYLKVA